MLFQYNEGRKIIKIGNDLELLQRVKERFDLDGEIVLQKYNDSWEEWVDVSCPEICHMDKIKVVRLAEPRNQVCLLSFVVPCERENNAPSYINLFVGGCMLKPPIVIIKEAFYNLIKNDKVLSDSHLQEVAKRTLLSVEELNMHVDQVRLMAQRRKEGAKKAAYTKAKEKKW